MTTDRSRRHARLAEDATFAQVGSSLRHDLRWNSVRFHETLVSLLDLVDGERVLDLGCGSGASLGPLLAAVGVSGEVVGLDQAASSLAEVDRWFRSEIASRRLMLVRGHAAALPFRSASFDAILCQNVVECVVDRQALVSQAIRVLKPGGRLLLGHHDFDGVMLSSDDRELTRRLVHAFADHQQAWQEASEGRMGRLLPGLVADADVTGTRVAARLIVDLDLGAGSYAGDYVDWLNAMAPALGFDRDELTRWTDDLERDAEAERFFFALPSISVLGRKATDGPCTGRE